jgi:hypothetical protein
MTRRRPPLKSLVTHAFVIFGTEGYFRFPSSLLHKAAFSGPIIHQLFLTVRRNVTTYTTNITVNPLAMLEYGSTACHFCLEPPVGDRCNLNSAANYANHSQLPEIRKLSEWQHCLTSLLSHRNVLRRSLCVCVCV